jgi:hypothetical protein
MIQVDDDDSFGSIDNGTAFHGAQVHISLQALDGKYEKWQRLTALQSGYNSAIQEQVVICEFDPGDDQIAPANETMCDSSPLWSDIGDIIGTDASCTFDTDGNDPGQLDCGEVSCAGGPGCTENNSVATSASGGVWGRSTFDLSPFNGRQARLRWIGMTGGGWSFGTSRSLLEPTSGSPFNEWEFDDGWWIDDIKLTDIRTGPTPISPDPNVGTAVCLTDANPLNCGSVTINIANSLPFALPGDAGGRVVLSDALGMPVTLDARGTTASAPACDNGVLKFEWAQVPSGATGLTDPPIDLIQDYSASGAIQVAPLTKTTYRVRVLCSSDPACTASKLVAVSPYRGDGTELDSQFEDLGGSHDLTWIYDATPALQCAVPLGTQLPSLNTAGRVCVGGDNVFGAPDPGTCAVGGAACSIHETCPRGAGADVTPVGANAWLYWTQQVLPAGVTSWDVYRVTRGPGIGGLCHPKTCIGGDGIAGLPHPGHCLGEPNPNDAAYAPCSVNADCRELSAACPAGAVCTGCDPWNLVGEGTVPGDAVSACPAGTCLDDGSPCVVADDCVHHFGGESQEGIAGPGGVFDGSCRFPDIGFCGGLLPTRMIDPALAGDVLDNPELGPGECFFYQVGPGAGIGLGVVAHAPAANTTLRTLRRQGTACSNAAPPFGAVIPSPQIP